MRGCKGGRWWLGEKRERERENKRESKREELGLFTARPGHNLGWLTARVGHAVSPGGTPAG